jgi:ubiquinone/menaquinone biosynthesis C-methylase UbiE
MAEFQDLFSKQAEIYAKSRPRYPKELYEYLAGLTPSHDIAWDCATGNGQAAVALSGYFKEVIATDASESQIQHAEKQPNITYRVATAEDSGIESDSIDLVTVATALHWLDLDEFFKEVDRVAKPGCVFAAWSYFEVKWPEGMEDIIIDLGANILKGYWAKSLKKVEHKYEDIPFPFEEIKTPYFEIRVNWTLEELRAYLYSMSSTQNYINANNKSPIDLIESRLQQAWGNPQVKKELVFPLVMRVGRVRK